MTKIKGEKLQELAAMLATNKQMTNEQLSCVKGGCSSCEDTRRPPRI